MHYEDNDSDIEPGKLVTFDCGAEYGHYSSDITRTFPVSGKFTQPQKALYQVVLNAQKAAIAAVEPGQSINDLQAIAKEVLTLGLRRLAILTDESTEEELDKYFPHPLGHHMGIDVHDGNCCFLEELGLKKEERKSLPLQPGMVFTIEPGIYIKPNDSEVPEEFRGLGIRIEDDILVTKDGCEVLSKDIPKEVDAIEAVMQKGCSPSIAGLTKV